MGSEAGFISGTANSNSTSAVPLDSNSSEERSVPPIKEEIRVPSPKANSKEIQMRLWGRIYDGLLLATLVEPLIGWVEFWKHHNQDLHFPDRSMARSRPNQDAHPGMNRDCDVIQLHGRIRLALEKIIRFRQSPMVVKPCVLGNLGNMNRAGIIRHVRECSPSGPAGTGNPRDTGKVNQFVPGTTSLRHPERPG